MSRRNALVIAFALGCSRPSGAGSSGDVSHARNHAMQYSATVVASGVTRPRRVPAPLYAVARTPEAWGALLAREGLSGALGASPPPDFERVAALWITGRDEGGLDRRPAVTAITREAESLVVTAAMRNVEGGQALDVELRAWTVVTVDRRALEAAAVRVVVDGEDARVAGDGT